MLLHHRSKFKEVAVKKTGNPDIVSTRVFYSVLVIVNQGVSFIPSVRLGILVSDPNILLNSISSK